MYPKKQNPDFFKTDKKIDKKKETPEIKSIGINPLRPMDPEVKSFTTDSASTKSF